MDLDQALSIIDAAVEQSDKRHGADDETLIALRFLWRYDNRPALREAIVWFKESLDGDNYIGRFQNANASRNMIRRLTRS